MYIIYIGRIKKFIMFKKLINVLWTYSPQAYWIWLWTKTQIDEKVKEKVKRVKKAVKVLKNK